MNKTTQYLLFGIGLLFIFWLGCRDRPDPVWQATEKMLRQDFLMLDDAADSVNLLFNQFHDIQIPDNQQLEPKKGIGYQILSTPFLPTAEWKKFKECFGWLEKNKAAVVASVNGSGATTITNRLANFIAARPQNYLEVKCAPQFDMALHQKFIGYEDEHGVFHAGELLDFWHRAAQSPEERFVFVLDNFDKINPETFFGPELWEQLGDPQAQVLLGGQKITIPANFYMLSVIHAGGAGKINFTNEHFRRLGGLHILEPTPIELIEYLRNKKTETEKTLAKATNEEEIKKLNSEMAALSDTAQLTRFVVFFSKMNAFLAEKYSVAHQLGQWSNVRKMYRAEDFANLRRTFLNHINALEPSRPLLEKDLESIDYTLETNGLAAESNFFDRQINYLKDTGYFVEITIVAATSLLTALFGWWVFRRREQILRNYGKKTKEIFEQYEKQILNADDAAQLLENIKSEVDELVLSRKINYTEALYFLAFIENKVKRIEFAKNTSETFRDLMNTFLEDNVLTDNEHKKLLQFLHSIRHKIPESEYQRFRDEVERVQRDFRQI